MDIGVQIGLNHQLLTQIPRWIFPSYFVSLCFLQRVMYTKCTKFCIRKQYAVCIVFEILWRGNVRLAAEQY